MIPLINKQKRLTECKQGVIVKIKSIATGSGAMRNLTSLGLNPGNIVKILRISRLGGPVLVESGGSEIAIGRHLAQKIQVEASQ